MSENTVKFNLNKTAFDDYFIYRGDRVVDVCAASVKKFYRAYLAVLKRKNVGIIMTVLDRKPRLYEVGIRKARRECGYCYNLVRGNREFTYVSNDQVRVIGNVFEQLDEGTYAIKIKVVEAFDNE